VLLFYFFHFFVVELPPKVRIYLLEKLAELEVRLAAGTNEKLQLSSLVATFQTVRNEVAEDAAAAT